MPADLVLGSAALRIEWGVMTRMAWTAADDRAGTATDATSASTVRRLASVWSAPDGESGARATDARTDGVRELYERSHADMVRFAAFLTGNVDAAEDVAQEAFVRVFDAWDRIEDRDRIEAYLRTTVVNVVRGGFRRDAVAARRAERHLAAVPSAEDDAIGRLGREVVLTAVSSLPLQQRACVVMRHWMRMSESEIAATLGISIGSVRTHVKRGTAALKDRLGGAR